MENLLTSKPQLMAILNLTPDSFSDGGQFNRLDAAVKRCEQLIEEGADILDLGGESTRPGAAKVSSQEEMDRVLPVLEVIKKEFSVPVSVDTSNENLMQSALELKADIINDVRALQKVDDLDFLARSSCAICLMHMQGEPDTMQQQANYEHVVQNVLEFLRSRVKVCVNAGISKERLIVDPGFGFGKTLQHNLSLLNQLEAFTALELPVLVGTSRKSMIALALGKSLKNNMRDRLYGSLATVALAVQKGAKIIRVHDVAASRDVIDMTWAVMNEDVK